MGFNDCYHDTDTFPHRENNERLPVLLLLHKDRASAWVNSIKSPKTNLRFAEVSGASRAGSP